MIRFPITNTDLAAQTGLDRLYTISVPPGTDVAAMADQLSFYETHLEFASVAWYGEFAGNHPNDPLLTDQWYLENTGQALSMPCAFPYCACTVDTQPPGKPNADIDCIEAWTLETGSPNIVIAVIDSGADYFHLDLINKLLPGHNFVPGEPDDESENGGIGHGTSVCGIIAAEANNGKGIAGVSWGSLVMPLRVGVLGPVDIATAANALAYAADPQDPDDPEVHIVNMSWGGLEARWQPILGPVVQFAHGEGLVLVAAAGNSAATPIIYPASDPLVIGVSATDSDDNLACFSNFGEDLSVAAPGQDIFSTFWPDAPVICPGEDYCIFHGTSFAAPQVCGVAALMLSANPALTNVQVKQIIEDTADDLGDPGFDPDFGHGRLNAYTAVCTVFNMPCLGDIDGDCIVSTADLLALFALWGSGPGTLGDLDCNKVVGTSDLLTLFANWGRCECAPPGGDPLTIEEELADACLTQDNWEEYMGVMMGSANQATKDRYQCWMEHYINDCNRCSCLGASGCPAPDPFDD